MSRTTRRVMTNRNYHEVKNHGGFRFDKLYKSSGNGGMIRSPANTGFWSDEDLPPASTLRAREKRAWKAEIHH